MPDAATAPGGSGRWLRGALVAAGLGFIAWLVADSLDDLRAALVTFDAPVVAVSVALGLAANVVAGVVFAALMTRQGFAMPARQGIGLVLVAQIAKYVPGKVFGLFYQAAAVGVGRQSVVVVTVCNLELMAMVALANLAIAVALLAAAHSVAGAAALFAAGLAATVAWDRLGLLTWLATLLPQRWRLLPAAPGRARPAGGTAALLYLSLALLNMPAMVLLLHGTVALPLADAFLLVAAMNVAMVAGSIAFVFPAGIGVRELVFIVLAQHGAAEQSLGVLTAVAVIARLWQVSVELAGALGWGLAQHLGRRG